MMGAKERKRQIATPRTKQESDKGNYKETDAKGKTVSGCQDCAEKQEKGGEGRKWRFYDTVTMEGQCAAVQ